MSDQIRQEERVWIEQALAGDHAAFGHLVEAYKAPIYNLAYRLLGDPAEAEDAAQETFLRVYTRLGTYQLDCKFSSWILSIASHYCIDRLRRRRLSWRPLEDLLARQAFADPHDGPEKVALQQEEQDTVRGLLGELPAQYRLLVTLRYWQELSYKEMAEILDTTESAIKSSLHRARCLLAERMKMRDTSHVPQRFGNPPMSEHNNQKSSSSPTSSQAEKVMQNAL